MKPRLQRRDWLHLQRFAPCESSTTCREVASGPLARKALHLRPFATFRSRPR